MRKGPRHAENLILDVQRVFADRLRDLLKTVQCDYTEEIKGTSAEAWYSFILRTEDPRPSVIMNIVGDAFVFVVNGAEMRLDLAAWGDDTEAWMRESLRVVDILLRNDLRIRLRRTLFGRSTGAVWIADVKNDGVWNGDRAACGGTGREVIFPRRWYKRTAC